MYNLEYKKKFIIQLYLSLTQFINSLCSLVQSILYNLPFYKKEEKKTYTHKRKNKTKQNNKHRYFLFICLSRHKNLWC